MNIFSYDSKLVHILNRLTDLMILNLLTIIGLVPIFCLLLTLTGFFALTLLTVGVSALSVFSGMFLSALHYCLIKMVRNEESYTFRSFFKSCRDNWKQGSLIGTLFLLFFGILWADTRIFAMMPDTGTGGVSAGTVMSVICYIVMALAYFAFLYVFPLQARFVNSVRATLKNSLLIAVLSFPRTLLMAAVWIVVTVLLYFFSVQIMPFMILFGISVPAYLCAYIYSPVLRRFEPSEEKATDVDNERTDERVFTDEKTTDNESS